MSRYKKAQSLSELSIVFFIVAAALVSMQVYVRRGIQAAVRAQADLLGPQVSNTGPSRKVSSTNTVSTETGSGSLTKGVSSGGSQSLSDTSSTSRSGSTTSVSTFNWN